MRPLILCLVFAIPAPAAEPTPPASAVKVNRYKIKGDRRAKSEGVGGWGSGTVVASGKGESLVLTNAHIAPDSNAFYFVIHDEYTFMARWVGASGDADLALLKVDVELPAADLAPSPPAVGSRVSQWGCTAAGPMRFAEGVTEADDPGRRDWERRTFLQSTIRSSNGDSGCGLFDARGRLVGVTYGGPLEGHGGPSYAMHVGTEVVRGFLSKHTGVKAATGTPATPAVAGPLREMPPLSKDK
jgi:S1-C subfamily serine protease